MRRSVGKELGNHEKVFGTVRAIEWNEVLHGQIRHRGCHSGYVFLYIVNNLLFVIFPPIAFFFCLCLWTYFAKEKRARVCSRRGKNPSLAREQYLIPWRRRARHSLAKIIIIQLISCPLLHLFYTTSNNETGLAEHKDTLGSPLCPCRHYDDKEAEVKAGFWNCPCIPMRERKECHCMLFLTEDNDFAGDDNTITIEEINEAIEDM